VTAYGGMDLSVVHADERGAHQYVPQRLPSPADALRLECTADLQADTLSFAWKGFDLSALTISIPRLSECFVYAAKSGSTPLEVELDPSA
jgi:hypothetical protein